MNDDGDTQKPPALSVASWEMLTNAQCWSFSTPRGETSVSDVPAHTKRFNMGNLLFIVLDY